MTPFERPSIAMSNQSIDRSLIRIRKGMKILNLGRRDLSHPNTRVWERVISPVTPLKLCTNKITHLKVGINQ
jgi:hypothetical protein